MQGYEWRPLLDLLTFLAIPAVIIGLFVSHSAALTYSVAYVLLFVTFCLLAFVASQRASAMERRYFERYDRGIENGDAINCEFHCLFDVHSDSVTSIHNFFRDGQLSAPQFKRIGIIFSVTSNPHIGSEIHYWSKGVRHTCPAWGDAQSAKQGRFIRITYTEEQLSNGSTTELPIKIEIEA